jgi:hypothetical protein
MNAGQTQNNNQNQEPSLEDKLIKIKNLFDK